MLTILVCSMAGRGRFPMVQQNPTLWQRIKAVIGRNGDPEGKPSLEDENEKTGWIEYLKDSFLSPESQEVIEDIGRLIGQEH